MDTFDALNVQVVYMLLSTVRSRIGRPTDTAGGHGLVTKERTRIDPGAAPPCISLNFGAKLTVLLFLMSREGSECRSLASGMKVTVILVCCLCLGTSCKGNISQSMGHGSGSGSGRYLRYHSS